MRNTTLFISSLYIIQTVRNTTLFISSLCIIQTVRNTTLFISSLYIIQTVRNTTLFISSLHDIIYIYYKYTVCNNYVSHCLIVTTRMLCSVGFADLATPTVHTDALICMTDNNL